jgi:putative ABC transport system permease protein
VLLAFSEIRRAKTRFALLAGAVAILVFLILFLQALFNGLINDFIGAIENQNSPVLVLSEDSRSNVEASVLPPQVEDGVAAVDGVAQSGLIGQGTYTVVAGGEDRDAVLFGYELGGLGEPLTLTEGRLPTAANEGVASAADAAKGFDIGDEVTVVGEAGPIITIVGLGEDLRWSVNPTIFVSYDTYEQSQLAVNPGSDFVLASLVAVTPEEGVSDEELTTRIEAAVDGVEALTNEEAVAANPGVQGVSNSSQIILALAFLVVAILVGFFFLILTTQKAKPLTLLRAIGARSRYLVWSLALQILVVLAVGSMLGILLVLIATGSDATGDVSVSIEPGRTLVTVIGIALISAVGGVVAAVRVLRIDPIRATTDTSRSL